MSSHSSSPDLLLAIDNGTQSVPLQAYYSDQPGWAEQQPEYYWQSLCQACQGLWASQDTPPGLRSRLAGVVLTGQRATVVNVDRQGKPLRPAMLWLDQRRTYGLKPVGGWWGLAFRLAGISQTVAYLQAEAEANWLMKHQPEIWSQTYKFLYLSGYLTYRLVGRFVDSVGCQVGYMPFDYKRLGWATKSDWKWQAVPLDKSLLPELVSPCSLLGEITPQAAQDTGIPVGLPLVASAADKACEVIGSGALHPQIGCLSYGTTASIAATHTRYIEPIPLIPPYPSAVPGRYCLEVNVFRGFWMVSWFKQEFGEHEQRLAEARQIEPEALFDELVQQVPSGSMGLVLQPYWSPGLKVPGPEAKGAVIGFGDVHTRAHFYRAILEGLAYALREGKERIERRTRIPIRELRVSGGGSQSDAALQIAADVFGLPASRPHLYETSGLGAAINLAVGLGLHSDFTAAVQAMTRIQRVFEPDPQAHALYDGLYRRVYLRMYHQLKPLYEDIRQITGYPVEL